MENSTPSAMVRSDPISGPCGRHVQQGMVRPGHRGARQQQDQGVEQRQVPGIETSMPAGGQTPPVDLDARRTGWLA
jgi:hypothetical protein